VAPAPPPVEEAQKVFTVKNGAGFLLEREIRPSGRIIATHMDRNLLGEDDIVYTDIGRQQGGKIGARYSIYKDAGSVSHPVTNFIMGSKIIPLGSIQLADVEEDASKGIITKSFLEIGTGAYLLPYKERRREVALKASDRDLSGYILDSQTGDITMGAGDITFIDLGSSKGVEVGNLLYIVRDVSPDPKQVAGKIGKLPVELLGALVVVETGENTSTGLIVKSIEAIYPGDRVELRKSK